MIRQSYFALVALWLAGLAFEAGAETLNLVAAPQSDGHVLDTNYFGASELDGEGDCTFAIPGQLNNGCLAIEFLATSLTIPYEAIDPGLLSFPASPFFQLDSEVCACINQSKPEYQECVSIVLPTFPVSGAVCGGYLGAGRLVAKFPLDQLPEYASVSQAILSFKVEAAGAPVDVIGFTSEAGELQPADYGALGQQVATAVSPTAGAWEIDVSDTVASAHESGVPWIGFRLQLTTLTSEPLTAGVVVQLSENKDAPPALTIDYAVPPQVILVSASQLDIPEDTAVTINVSLLNRPTVVAAVSIERVSGDPDLVLETVGPLVFKPDDFTAAQAITFRSVADVDYLLGEAEYRISTDGADEVRIFIREKDDEVPPPRLYVDAESSAQPMDGSGWGSAFSSLSDCLSLAKASAGSVMEVWVAEGVYRPDDAGGRRDRSFELVDGLAIFGGFAGTEVALTERPVELRRTILSGDLNGDDAGEFTNRTDNSYHVIRADGISASLDGVTISGGDSTTRGGGVYATQSQLELSHCAFTQCSATHGGAIFHTGQLNLQHCTFDRNRATSVGGALVNADGSNAEIRHCTFTRNRVERVFLLGGGAIYNGTGSSPLISSSLFIGNQAIGGALGGAVYNHNCDATVANSIFIGNFTENDGGAIANLSDGGDQQSHYPTFSHCTIAYNFAKNSGGGMISSGLPFFVGSFPTITNSILWGNVDSGGPELEAQALHPLEKTGTTSIEHSCVMGGWPDANPTRVGHTNIDLDPMLTPDGHLRAGSPCIDAGNPLFILDPPTSTDIDGEPRIHNARVDMGADEFIGADLDGLPVWWLAKYGGNAIADEDGDGLLAIDEYELASSDPTIGPVYVDGRFGNDNWDGTIPFHIAGTELGPKASIQAGIDVAAAGNTVLVRPGVYRGELNLNLDFRGKQLVLRSLAGPQATRLDGELKLRAAHIDQRNHPATIIEGFTFLRGLADADGGGLLRYARGAVGTLRSCILNAAESSGRYGGVAASQAMVRWVDTVLIGMPSDQPVHFAGRANVEIEGDLLVRYSNIAVSGSTLAARGQTDGALRNQTGDYSQGRIVLGERGVLTVQIAESGGEGVPTSLRCPIVSGPTWGAGEILVKGGAELAVEGTSVIDLGGVAGGHIIIEGTMIVRDQAAIRNSNISVVLLALSEDADVADNNIRLLDIPNFGGQLFVEDAARILNNVIVSEGDRYFDFDPDPAHSSGLTIAGNQLFVVIKEGTQGDQGALLELRALDHECVDSVACPAGAFAVSPKGLGFSSDNWVLDELEVLENAKVNLTNRQGFVFQPQAQHPETVYVKRLKLHPKAVVNTGLQTMYYGDLIDHTGQALYRDPLDPFAELANGSRFTDIPVLGFSLISIEMESDREFGIRVRRWTHDDPSLDPEDPTTPAGSIKRIQTPASGGVMEMRTHHPAHHRGVDSVKALGSFARAGDENITIVFQYLFLENDQAELVVSLSDNPDIDGPSVEVARIAPPTPGRPGSIGGNRFATFYGVFPRGELRFVRGTYVGLTLRGADSRIWIDRWDPQIVCTSTCADLDGGQDVTGRDFLLQLAEYGQAVDPLDPSGKGCLDSSTTQDLYIDMGDVLAWDTWLSGVNLNACGPGAAVATAPATASTTAVPLPLAESLLIAGKTREPGLQEDFLFSVDIDGSCLGDRLAPAAAPDPQGGQRSNGRLLRDGEGLLYQIHATQGLLRLDDGERVIRPKFFDNYQDGTGHTVDVQVGVRITSSGDQGAEFRGVPLLDAAFDPTDPSVLYVVPVEVDPGGGSCPYRAAAKLRRNNSTDYALERLYGWNPERDPVGVTVNPTYGCGFVMFSPDKQRLREIEIDDWGNVYVLAATAGDMANDWVLVYDQSVGTTSEQAIALHDESSPVHGPTAMLISHSRDQVLLASALNQGPMTHVFHFDIERNGTAVTGLVAAGTTQIDNLSALPNDRGYGHLTTITDIEEHPQTGTLFVLGFAMPRFAPRLNPNDGVFDVDQPIFTTPTIAIIPPGAYPSMEIKDRIMAQEIACDQLALPLSITFRTSECGASGSADHDTDVDLADFAVYQDCIGGPASTKPCQSIDIDCIGDIDLGDYRALHRRLLGPN